MQSCVTDAMQTLTRPIMPHAQISTLINSPAPAVQALGADLLAAFIRSQAGYWRHIRSCSTVYHYM